MNKVSFKEKTSQPNIPKLFGENLRIFRKEKGFSVIALSKLAGISHTTVSSYEKGYIFPTAKTWKKLCAIFNREPKEFLYTALDHEIMEEAKERIKTEAEIISSVWLKKARELL